MIQKQSNKDKTCLQEGQCDTLQALKKRESLYILDYMPSKKKPRRSAIARYAYSPRTIDAITTSETDGTKKSVPTETSSSTSTMRGNVCQWMYKVVDFCDYDRKVTFLA